MSATSATGAAGTPAAVRRRCHSAVSSSPSRCEMISTSASRFRTRSGFVRKRSSSTRSGQFEHAAERAEEAVVAAGDHEVAVTSREDLIGRDHREDRSLAARNGPVREVADEVVADVASDVS